MNWIDPIGYIAATLTTFAFLPQLVKIVKTRSVHDISFLMYLVMLIGVGLWLIYGFYIQSWPLAVANGFTFLFVFIILILKLKWK